MNEESRNKHVIILGAGASKNSGYPLANDLRLLMTSQEKAKQRLQELNKVAQTKISDEEIDKAIGPMFRGNMEKPINLFRNGGFATVDEFSRLAGSHLREEVQSLKKALSMALALHDPEDTFHDSEYYPFIQKLFHGALFPMRTDVSILTFNYDAYLPFLLQRAAKVRSETSGSKEISDCMYCLLSGFDGRAVGALESANDFCLLHLHGMMAWPERHDDEPGAAFRDVFQTKAYDRLTRLHGATPPIVFPWEVIDKNGEFRAKSDFCLVENCDHQGRRKGRYTGNIDLYALFTSIWKRARKEIETATKISFVGLSMHEFLNPSFKFLFHNKRNDARIIVANPDLAKFRDGESALKNPRSPAFKVRRLLKDIWPREEGGSCGDGMVNVESWESFVEFIQYEMD